MILLVLRTTIAHSASKMRRLLMEALVSVPVSQAITMKLAIIRVSNVIQTALPASVMVMTNVSFAPRASPSGNPDV